VLALQCLSGNAAVGRLLRQIAQPDEVTGRRVPVQHDWGVTYQLPFAADADGWMIQELYMEASGPARRGQEPVASAI
jgi:hypothetical protein